MRALLLRCAAPMQAWGTQSRFSIRETQREPSKSGIIGLLCAALGRHRRSDLSELAELGMGVRVDREGRLMRDYHTVGGGSLPPAVLALYGVKSYGVSRANRNGTEAAVTNRYFLADARFLVGLSGEEALLLQLTEALRSPVFPLFLGRKCFVPAEPVLHDDQQPLREGATLREILEMEPWHPNSDHELRWEDGKRVPSPDKLRLVLEEPASGGGSLRQDTPKSFEKGNRLFGERNVLNEFTVTPITRWIEAQTRKEGAA